MHDLLLSFELTIENRKTNTTTLVNSSELERKKKDGFSVLNELIQQTSKNELQAAVLYTAVCYFKADLDALSRFDLRGTRLAILERVKGIYERKKAKERREFAEEIVNNIAYNYKMLPAPEKIVLRDLQRFIQTNLQ